MSRIENGATFRDVVRAATAMIGVYCRTSHRRPPKSVTLDIDNAIFPTYGNQQGARWSTHHDAHGYAPFYVFDVATCATVAAVLFPAKTPSGAELLPLAEALVRSIRRHWPDTRIILRGERFIDPARPPPPCSLG